MIGWKAKALDRQDSLAESMLSNGNGAVVEAHVFTADPADVAARPATRTHAAERMQPPGCLSTPLHHTMSGSRTFAHGTSRESAGSSRTAFPAPERQNAPGLHRAK